MAEKRILVACNVFQEELKKILANNGRFEVETLWLQAGLHMVLETLEKNLKGAIENIPAENAPQARIIFGHGCLPQMKELAAEWDIPALPVRNCLAAMVGDEKLAILEQGNTMVTTPGYIRKLLLSPDGIKKTAGWNNDDFRMNFGRYDRLLVLEAGLSPLTDEETLEAFDLVEVPLETEPISLDHFQKIIFDFLA